MRLAHQLWGSRDSSDRFVLLHGMGGTGALWRPVAAGLEDFAWVCAPDQRGHGGSRDVPAGEGFAPLAFGADVVETCEEVGFFPAWLVGHSMGVRTACAAAHLRPEGVRGLVLVDLGFTGPAGGGLGDGLASFLKILPEGFASRAEARAYLDERCPDPAIARYLGAVLRPAGEGAASGTPGAVMFPFDRAALIATLEAVRSTSVAPWVREAAGRGIPVLALRGAESGVWSRADFEATRAAFADCPGVRFEELEGAGHGLPFEQRARFVARLREFAGL